MSLTGVFIGGVHGRAARTVLGGRGLTEGGIQHAGDILRYDGCNQGGRVVLDGRALVLCIARELQRQNAGRGGDLREHGAKLRIDDGHAVIAPGCKAVAQQAGDLHAVADADGGGKAKIGADELRTAAGELLERLFADGSTQ